MKTPHSLLPPASRITVVAAALALFLLPAPRLHAQQSLADDPGVADALHLLDVWMDAAQAYGGIPGASLSVVHDQELVWAKGYGYAHVEREEPATSSTMYSICSISKLFTAVGVLQLRDQGNVELDDPVAKHLDWFRIRDDYPEAGPVTVEGLLTHTSGLPREAGAPYWTGPDYPFPTHEEIVATLPTQSMLYPPRTYYQYSNLALTLAGEIVAAASGQAYDDYIRANILDPLGMSSTFTDLDDRFRGNRLASGYTARGRDGQRQLVPDYSVRGISPAAGFVSTVEDLGAFRFVAVPRARRRRRAARPQHATRDAPGALARTRWRHHLRAGLLRVEVGRRHLRGPRRFLPGIPQPSSTAPAGQGRHHVHDQRSGREFPGSSHRPPTTSSRPPCARPPGSRTAILPPVGSPPTSKAAPRRFGRP